MIPPRRLVTLTIVVAGVSLAAAAIGLKWRDSAAFFRPEVLLSRFPAEDGIAMSIDFASLRRAGLLGASKTPLEDEYRQFLDATGFDYRRDLDQAIASFSKSGSFFIARGRFNWPKLRRYANLQGGSCYEQLCRMQGSRPERHISFLPLRNDVLALAVGADDMAATKLTHTGDPVKARIPSGPAWLSLPGSALRDPGVFPPGLRVVLSGLVNADRVLVTAGLGSGLNPGGVEVRMDATCRTPDDANLLASQLRNATAILKEALARDKTMRTDDLARALAAGSFDRAGTIVAGRWPAGRDLLESLTAGI